MPAMSRIALTVGLVLGASAAPNSIVAPTGAEKLTVGLLGGTLDIYRHDPKNTHTDHTT